MLVKRLEPTEVRIAIEVDEAGQHLVIEGVPMLTVEGVTLALGHFRIEKHALAEIIQVDQPYNKRGHTVLEHPVTSHHIQAVRGGKAMADPQSTSTRLCGMCGLVEVSHPRKYCSSACAKSAFLTKRAIASKCADCQKPCRRDAKRCSPCHVAWKVAAPRGADGRFPGILVNRSCRFCGGQFEPRDSKSVYCSRECAYADPKWRGDRFRFLAEKRAEKIADRQRQRAAITALCVSCGQEFPCGTRGRKACSRECLTKWLRAAAIQHYRRTRRPDPGMCRCRECDAQFEPVYPSKHRSFCSAECLETYSNRIGRAQRRARMLEAVREPVDPIAVCERDGWRCQLCGVSTPRRLRGTHFDNAPEMDHIIPLALGGSHTYTNVQCACRRCNSIKGARPLGQLRLA